ncbi:MAG: flagellar hook-length control protein FliK, partial [Bdellovibrio sp.]
TAVSASIISNKKNDAGVGEDKSDKKYGKKDATFFIPKSSQNHIGVNKDSSVLSTNSFKDRLEQDATIKENVEKIIQQAQFLSKKGGGSVKVKLSPEGLGHVDLRVNMDGGKVHVEMITSSDEAKKVLENGIKDLKTSLMSQKLHVQDVKIDHTQSSQSHNLDMSQNAERNFQEGFLNQFMQDNQSTRENLIGGSVVKEPQSQILDEPGSETRSRSARGRSQRRLDLVA